MARFGRRSGRVASTYERAMKVRSVPQRCPAPPPPQKVPAILELAHLGVLKRGVPPLQFLPPERDVPRAPENERRLVREGGAVLPDRAQPAARAHDVAWQRGARGPCCGRRLCAAVVGHDLRRQNASVADRSRHDPVHEDVVLPQQVLADPARHQEAERLEVEIVPDCQHQVFAMTRRLTRSGCMRAKSRPIGPPQSFMNRVISRRSRWSSRAARRRG